MSGLPPTLVHPPPPPPRPAATAPSREDPLVARLSAVIGGPAGGRLARHRGPWQAATVLVLLAVALLAAGLASKQHCRAEGWTDPDQFFHACYSDLPAQFGVVADDALALPDVLAELGTPPIAGTAMWLVARAVPAGGPGEQALAFFDLSAVVLAAVLAVAVALLALCTRGRPWDAAHLALSPVIVTSALISYDLLAVLLVVAAVLAWSRRAPVACGVLLGAAVATRPLAAVVALALLGLALRTARWAPVLLAVGTAAAVWLGLRVLLLPGFTGELGTAWQTWRSAPAGYGSLWLVPRLLGESRPRSADRWFPLNGLDESTVSVLAVLGVLVVVLGTLLLALAPQFRPRLAHLALFAAAGVLLVSKAAPPQAALLLLPFVALAGLRWRDHLVWAGAEVVYFVAVWLHIAAGQAPDRALTPAFYALLLLVRSGALVWLMVCAVRAARDPLLDPIRRRSADAATLPDPHAGPIGDAPDALVVRIA